MHVMVEPSVVPAAIPFELIEEVIMRAMDGVMVTVTRQRDGHEPRGHNTYADCDRMRLGGQSGAASEYCGVFGYGRGVFVDICE